MRYSKDIWNEAKAHEAIVVGEKYGSLTIIKLQEPIKWYMCQCDCGNKVVASYTHLSSGKTTNCGCVNKVKTTDNPNNNKTYNHRSNTTCKIVEEMRMYKDIIEKNMKGFQEYSNVWPTADDLLQDIYMVILELEASYKSEKNNGHREPIINRDEYGREYEGKSTSLINYIAMLLPKKLHNIIRYHSHHNSLPEEEGPDCEITLDNLSGLSKRQGNIVKLIVDGYNDEKIAEIMSLSSKTIKREKAAIVAVLKENYNVS